ncbi:hypothetical protein B5M50_03020 [candidate division KSB1 bacterium 4484_219]|nr:MAG: hypothetical protein B5M50_03020 [candidate division KSB1 bacterium 4484_219]
MGKNAVGTVLILISLAFIVGGGFAAGSVGTTGYEFLRTPVGARPAALGGAFIAVPKDVCNIYYNPAGLAEISNRSLTASYLNHLLDFQSGFFAYGQPFEQIGVVGVGVYYIDYGLSATLTTARLLTPQLLAGVSIKWVYSKIAQYSSDAFAFDVGLIYHTSVQDLDVGAGIFNIGWVRSPFIHTKEDLPLNFRVGFAKRLAHLPLLLSGEVYKYLSEDYNFAFGGEFTITPNLFLRFGYNSVGRAQKIDAPGDKHAGFSFGIGVDWHGYQFDYSLTSSGSIGSLNRFSVSRSF